MSVPYCEWNNSLTAFNSLLPYIRGTHLLYYRRSLCAGHSPVSGLLGSAYFALDETTMELLAHRSGAPPHDGRFRCYCVFHGQTKKLLFVWNRVQ